MLESKVYAAIKGIMRSLILSSGYILKSLPPLLQNVFINYLNPPPTHYYVFSELGNTYLLIVVAYVRELFLFLSKAMNMQLPYNDNPIPITIKIHIISHYT